MLSKLAFASFMGLSLAQTTVITLSVLGGGDDSSSGIVSSTVDPDNYFASIIGVTNQVTTMQVQCSAKPGVKIDPEDEDDCVGGTATWLYGPSTFSLNQSYNGTLYGTIKCDYSSFHGQCTDSFVGFTTDADFHSSDAIDSASVGPTDFVAQLMTVTAGADKLGPATGSASPASSATTSGPAKTGSAAAGSSTGTAAGSAAPPKKTNAAAGNAVAMGGALLGAAAGVFGGLL